MVEVAVRDPKTGLLIRDGIRYPPKAAEREIRNLAKQGQEGRVVDLQGRAF